MVLSPLDPSCLSVAVFKWFVLPVSRVLLKRDYEALGRYVKKYTRKTLLAVRAPFDC